jgi:hypothetical protein
MPFTASRLREMQMMGAAPANRFTAARFLQALAVAKGHSTGALAYAEAMGGWWDDQGKVVAALKAAVESTGTADYPASYNPVADSFLAAMRTASVPLRLTGMLQVPMLTRLFINSSRVIAVRVAEGASIPAMRGDWTSSILEPLSFAALTVTTAELAKASSPVAALGLSNDLAAACAEEENRYFVSPDLAGSVLYGKPSFTGTGSALSNVDADLQRLVDLVPGAHRGAAFVMTQQTATHLSLLRGDGGAAAFPNIGPTGGELLGLEVLITDACQEPGSPPTRVIGLIDPAEVVWADEGRVILTASTQAAIEMTIAPTADASSGTAGTTSLVSMFQANAVALKAVRESSWYARSGSGAYFVAGY